MVRRREPAARERARGARAGGGARERAEPATRGPAPSASRTWSPSTRRAWPVARWRSTRCSAPASRARRTARWPRHRGAQRRGLPIVAADVPSGRRRRQRRGGGRGDPRPRDGDLRRGQAGAVDQPRQVARGAVRVIDIGIRTGAPDRRARRRPHRRCGAARAAALARGRVDEVHERARARRGRRARAHGAPSLASEAAQRAGPATSRPASPPRRSRSSPSGCSRR
jgi:hypothetical protein